MDRRKSIKALIIGTASTGVLINACQPADKSADKKGAVLPDEADRMQEEKLHNKRVQEEEAFFTPEEMATITVLVDIIIPKDEVSGSATEAGVPDFLAFIVKDMPEHQTPMRGGLRWLDMQSLTRFGKPFTGITSGEQIKIINDIAYPKKVKPGMEQGVAFFTLMRNLTVTGFYTTEMGGKDIEYIGNRPNQWNGVPDDVLKQYNLSYSEKDLKECISFNKA